jgi:hypothetical protein
LECAVKHRYDYIVVFGFGTDLYICDTCNKNDNSGSSLGGTYTMPPGIKFESNEAKIYLAGAHRFKVSEIEVYLVNKD